MAKEPLEITSWIGGQSADQKYGPEHSFAYSRHIDFRKKASGLTILPRTVETTGGIITGLPLNMIEVAGENFYIGDQDGGVYLYDAGSWAKLAGSIGSFQYGMAYFHHQDRLYLASDTTISSVKNAGSIFGTPTIEADTLGPSRDQSLTTTGNTYSSQSSVNEGATHRQSFTPHTEPFYSIKLLVAVKGTGSVTVTLHDEANNLLGSATLAAAAITNGVLNEWILTNAPRMNVYPNGNTYHVHVTHSGGTATTFTTTTVNDFETAAFETWSARMVGNDVGHPMIEFYNFLCIGNERYLSVWEPITTTPTDLEYLRHRLVFPSGMQVIGLAIWGDFLAIATGSWSNTSGGVSKGKIYFWGGPGSITYDQVLDIPEGAPQGIFSHLNRLHWNANGTMYSWGGGEIEPDWKLPNTDTEFKSLTGSTFVTPHMMTVRNGILLHAFPNSTYDPEIEFGVYSYGRRERNYPLSAGYSYTISTGTRHHETEGVALMQIGFLQAFGPDLFLGWADYNGGVTYGVDKVSPSNPPFAEATWESLIIDNGRPRKPKMANEFYITFETLPTGATVTPKYNIDREGWVLGTPATAGATEVKLNINKRYTEIQVGMDLTAATETPFITSHELIWDPNGLERD